MSHVAQNHQRNSFIIALKRILDSEGRNGIKHLAEKIGMDARNLQGRLHGRVHFTPEELTKILQVVADPRLADALLEGSPFVAVPRPPPAKHVPGAAPVAYAISAVGAAVAAMRVAARMQPRDAKAAAIVRMYTVEAQRQLAALLLALPLAPGSPDAHTDASVDLGDRDNFAQELSFQVPADYEGGYDLFEYSASSADHRR